MQAPTVGQVFFWGGASVGALLAWLLGWPVAWGVGFVVIFLLVGVLLTVMNDLTIIALGAELGFVIASLARWTMYLR